jgi:hypothetical protein
MTMNQDDRQGSGKPGASEGSPADDNTREGTKEDIRTKDEKENAASKDTPDNLRDGTRS